MEELCFDCVLIGWWDEVVEFGMWEMEEERLVVGALWRGFVRISSRGTEI